MIVTIHQPDFLPWLGFFHRWERSQRYIILDDVQFIRRGWHHRDRIKTPTGTGWLTVPVQKKGLFNQSIRDVRLEAGTSWRRKHLNTIRSCYGKAPYFELHFPFLENAYMRQSEFLMEFNMRLLEYAACTLGIETPVSVASDFHCQGLKGTERLVELTRQVGGTVYLTGTGSRGYLEEALFHEQGMSVEWQQFVHPEYPQLHGPFEAGMSVLDYMMMVRPAKSKGRAEHA